jgi:hypothetical protein
MRLSVARKRALCGAWPGSRPTRAIPTRIRGWYITTATSRTKRKRAMRKVAVLLLVLATSAFADTYRVHYSIKGSGHDITVQAESSAEARRVVMEMFPGAMVTGIHKIRR